MVIDLKAEAENLLSKVTEGAKSRGYRAANEMRNASLQVLRGQRSGRVYKKPHSRTTTYRASAPGEPPAVRSGQLRVSWRPIAESEKEAGAIVVKPAIRTDKKYAPILQDGSPKMAPRPFEELIIEKAMPKVKAIFEQPYLNG